MRQQSDSIRRTRQQSLRPGRRESPRNFSYCHPTIIKPELDFVSEDEAKWFLNLPEKVRRQYLCAEEVEWLNRLCEHSDTVTTPLPTESSPLLKATQSSGQEFHVARRRSKSLPALEIETAKMKLQMQHASKRATRASSETHGFEQLRKSVDPPPPTSRENTQKLVRRARTLTPLRLPAPTLAPMSSPSRLPSQPARSVTSRLSRPFIDVIPGLPSTQEESEPLFYQDPHVRLQLRQYIESPIGLDEAIEFGFPAPILEPRYSSSTADSADRHRLQPDYLADDDADSLDTHGPSTPASSTRDYQHTLTESASFDSGLGRPLPLESRTTATADSLQFPMPREMTLRLTLTNPELRLAKDEEGLEQVEHTLRAKVCEGDPLALDDLLVCDDASGSQGVFAVPEARRRSSRQGLRGIWKGMWRYRE